MAELQPGTRAQSTILGINLSPCTGAMCCPWDPCTAEVCMASPRLHWAQGGQGRGRLTFRGRAPSSRFWQAPGVAGKGAGPRGDQYRIIKTDGTLSGRPFRGTVAHGSWYVRLRQGGCSPCCGRGEVRFWNLAHAASLRVGGLVGRHDPAADSKSSLNLSNSKRLSNRNDIHPHMYRYIHVAHTRAVLYAPL